MITLTQAHMAVTYMHMYIFNLYMNRFGSVQVKHTLMQRHTSHYIDENVCTVARTNGSYIHSHLERVLERAFLGGGSSVLQCRKEKPPEARAARKPSPARASTRCCRSRPSPSASFPPCRASSGWSGCSSKDKDKRFKCAVVEFIAIHDFGEGIKGAGFQLKEMGDPH